MCTFQGISKLCLVEALELKRKWAKVNIYIYICICIGTKKTKPGIDIFYDICFPFSFKMIHWDIH